MSLARPLPAALPVESEQNCTVSLAPFCHRSAERCAQMAKDEVDPSRRSELETESRLWLQIAVKEDDLNELRKKAQNLLNAQAIRKAGSSRSG
jgi:hypothetical protein